MENLEKIDMKQLLEDISLMRLMPKIEKSATLARGLPVRQPTIYLALRKGPTTPLRRFIIGMACKIRDEAKQKVSDAIDIAKAS